MKALRGFIGGVRLQYRLLGFCFLFLTPVGNVFCQNGNGLKLRPFWKELYGGKVHSIDDLKKVLKPINKGKLDSKPYPSLQLIKGVPYLMPFSEAAEKLDLGRMVAGQVAGTPGFPAQTLHYKSYDGNFGGGFNRLFLVLYAADQFVSVQFVNESPGGINRGPGDRLALLKLGRPIHTTSDVQVFNFITLRKRGTSASTVRIEVKPVLGMSAVQKGKGKIMKPPLFAVDSSFRTRSGTEEIVRWIVPQPIVNLIYHCCTMKGVGTELSFGGLSTGGL